MTKSQLAPKQSRASEQLSKPKQQSITDAETIAAIRIGLEQARDGKAIPARAALTQLGLKLGIPATKSDNFRSKLIE